jgi:hypothetical protein
MYARISTLTRLLGVPDEFVKRIHGDGLEACVFRVENGAAAVAWSGEGQSRALKLAPDVRAYDIMGNEVPASEVVLGESPVYVVSAKADAVLETLSR